MLLFGATGSIGRASARALDEAGHRVTCFVRPHHRGSGTVGLPSTVTVRYGDVRDPASIACDGFAGESFDCVVSCIASRTGVPDDAWAIDYQANSDILAAARSSGARQMILVSAICVQKPRLAFQRAKLAFEDELVRSGLTYSIVRPTAFFKSLSSQIDRVRAGKPYLMFGDGRQTACKPISDADLGRFIAECIDDPAKHDAILPIGGRGPALTPLDMGTMLFELTGQAPRFRRVPSALLDVAIGVMSLAGKFSRSIAAKAEYARIGRYYATESMLVLDHGHYSPEATPEAGSDTLRDHYRRSLGIAVPAGPDAFGPDAHIPRCLTESNGQKEP